MSKTRAIFAIAFAAVVSWIVWRFLDKQTRPGGLIRRVTDTVSGGSDFGFFPANDYPGDSLSFGNGGNVKPEKGTGKCGCS